MTVRAKFRRWTILAVLLLIGLAAFLFADASTRSRAPESSLASDASQISGNTLFGLRGSLAGIGRQSGLAQEASPSCTLATTSTVETDSNWNNHSFETATQVANYTELSLVPSGIPKGDSAPTTPDFVTV
jgi:hypothetical protein